MDKSYRLPIYRKCYAFMISLLFLFSFIPANSLASGNFQLALDPGSKEITLQWNECKGAKAYQIFLYQVGGGMEPLFDHPRPILDYTHTGLKEDRTYFYKVYAYNEEGRVLRKTNKVSTKTTFLASTPENCKIELKYQIANKKYWVNGIENTMDAAPEINQNRTFLVVRFVTQHIPGTTLDWDGTERKVTIITPGGKTIRLWIGNPRAEVNGKMVLIDPENPEKVVPYIKDGRTKLPMRFVGEQLDAEIDWIPESSTVTLTIFDIINCACSWLEGCIVQWSEAPNDQYQVSFLLNCDKKSTLEQYLIDRNLKGTTDGSDLTVYLKKYPKPPYPGIKICLNQARKIIKWDPLGTPGNNPPEPPPPTPPPDPDPTPPCCDYQQFQVSQPIPTLKAGESSFYVFMIRNNCPTESKDISFQFAPLANVTEIVPKQLVLPARQEIMFKVFFRMPQNCIEGSNVNFSFKMGTNCSEKVEHSFTIQCAFSEAPPEPGKKWYCGCFSKFNDDSADDTKIWLNTSCKDPEAKWATYMIPKNLKDQNHNLSISEYMSKYPLKKYKSLCIELYADSKGAVEKWKARPEKFPDCCATTNKKGMIMGKITGTCNPGVTVTIYEGILGEVIWTGTTDINGNYQTSTVGECILPCPGTYKVVPTKEKYAFTESSAIVMFLKDDCCDPDSSKVKAKMVNFKGETTADPGRIVVHLGQQCSAAIVTVVNLSNPNQEKKTLEANIKGSCDTDCTMIFGDTYRVTPRRQRFRFNPEFKDVKIQDSCPDAITRVSFEAIEDPPANFNIFNKWGRFLFVPPFKKNGSYLGCFTSIDCSFNPAPTNISKARSKSILFHESS